MKPIIGIIMLFLGLAASGQQQSFDLFTFIPPKGWKKSEANDILNFLTINNANRTWARVSLVKSTASKGTPEADFASEWEQFAVKPYRVSDQPLGIDTQTINGWKVQTGSCQFLNNQDTVGMLITTFSNGQRCLSLLLQTNAAAYTAALDEFLASVNLPPANETSEKITDQKPALNTTPAASDGYQYNTTNFDDGWTSVVKADWVEATRGNIKVLLHYPRKEDEIYYTQHQERMTVFWNLLVAPRYSNLRHYEAPGSNLAESAYFANGLLHDKASGKDVWVTLFSKGKSGWIEIITPDKASFVKAFGIENPHVYYTEWNSLLNLAGMNRFAVGEKDLPGKWSNEFTGSTAYYSVYTGLYTGSTTFASRVNFIFSNNKTYNWDLVMGTGATGTTMKVDQAKASGSWKLLNNWQIWFSEIERKPKTYNAYFSCVKGGRILWLQDVEYGSYTAYGKISN